MLLETLLQTPPSTELPTEWAVWIIGVLIAFIGTIFLFIKWLVGLASTKVDSVVKEVRVIHREGIEQLSGCKDTLLRVETKLDSNFEELKVEQRETKYAIQTLNTKVKCISND